MLPLNLPTKLGAEFERLTADERKSAIKYTVKGVNDVAGNVVHEIKSVDIVLNSLYLLVRLCRLEGEKSVFSLYHFFCAGMPTSVQERPP